MTSLIRAELLKLRTTRMTLGLVLASLAFVVLTVTATVPPAGGQDAPLSLTDGNLLARVIGVSFGVPEVLMLLLGVLLMTQEFRYGTAASTYLVTPRRRDILTAKWLAASLLSVLITAATLVVSFAISLPLISSRHGSVTAGGELWQVVAASFAVLAVYGLIGVAIGALVRNQIAAVVGALVWMLAVEQILISTYPALGRWLPGGATFGLLQLGAAGTTKGNLLSVPMAALLLAAYTALACGLAFFLTPRRDIT